MSELRERVIEEAEQRRTLRTDDLVTLVERHHGDGSPGVDPDLLRAYAEEIGSRGGEFGRENAEVELESVSESETWTNDDRLYRVGDGRVSAYPRSWYDELGGETDLERYLEFILADVDDSRAAFQSGGQGEGVPQGTLLNVATVLGGMDWKEAKRELERLRDEGVVAEDADQHPNARVTFAERAERQDGAEL